MSPKEKEPVEDEAPATEADAPSSEPHASSSDDAPAPDAESQDTASDEPPEAEAPAGEEKSSKGGAAKAAPARRRRSRGERPTGPPPLVRAQAKYVRSSPRKARLVCDHIRGKTVDEARAILALTPRAVARDWSKLLESAVANAENNHELVGEDLYVKSVTANDGPTIRRFRPRAMGRATRIRKRTTHLTILLTPRT